MKTLSLVFLGSVLSFLAPTAGQEPATGSNRSNLLQNPGFEVGGTVPAAWTTPTATPADGVRGSKVSATGPACGSRS